MQFDRRHILAAGFAALCSLGSGQALAQAAWPAKAITVVVAYPPGGDTDAIARLFADKLSQKLKQTVLVDNKPGAGGTIGNAFVGRAPADGYTLLFTPNPFTTAPMVMNLSPSASYDVLNGFEPIIKIATQPLVLVAHPGAGVKSIAEMVTSAKGGKALSYASPGAGSPMHVVAEWLNRSAGVKIQHVPYRGVGPSVTDVVAGHVPMLIYTVAVLPHVRAGRLRALAVTSEQRQKQLPEVPTAIEQGAAGVVANSWFGLFGPARLPDAIRDKLFTALRDALAVPEVETRLLDTGLAPAPLAPAEFRAFIERDTATWREVVKAAGIKAE